MNIGDIIVSLKKTNGRFEVTKEFDRKALPKKGIWILVGKRKNENKFVCLNVGKNRDIGREIRRDLKYLACLCKSTCGGKLYINQFGEYCGFEYNSGKTLESLYPFISDRYDELIFAFAYDDNECTVERKIAEGFHALYWRNGGTYLNWKHKTFVEEEMVLLDKMSDAKVLLETCIKRKNRLR